MVTNSSQFIMRKKVISWRIKTSLQNYLLLLTYCRLVQYGQREFEWKWNLFDKYHHSIKEHTIDAKNQHQLKSLLSDLTSYNFQKLFYEVNLASHHSHLEVLLLSKFWSEREDFNWCRFWASWIMYFDAVVVSM